MLQIQLAHLPKESSFYQFERILCLGSTEFSAQNQMLRLRRCHAAIWLCTITLVHTTNSWSPLLQPCTSSRIWERSSLKQRRILPFVGREIGSNSFGRPTRLYGVLSRASILKHKSSSSRSKKHGQKHNVANRQGSSTSRTNVTPKAITVTFLMDAVEEAIYRQTTALECLEMEQEKLEMELRQSESTLQEDSQQHDSNIAPLNENYGNDNYISTHREEGKKKRNPESALERVAKRRIELTKRISNLEELRSDLVNGARKENSDGSSRNVATAESRFRAIVGSTGKPCSILDRPKDTWKIITERSKGEFGRPKGFMGLVFYSPLGVPILIGKPKADSDGILRRASQGSDLWFQVEDYDGSRVLLRSSLVRGTKNSKRCMQMAADLAAFYSIWGGGHRHDNNNSFDTVPVMYTDSKHVAKRGTKVGRMRKRKSLGRLMGRPSDVETITRGLEPS